MAKNKPLKDEEYDSIDEIQTTLDRHTDKLNRIEAVDFEPSCFYKE